MTERTRPYDTAEYLKTPDDVRGYLAAVLEDGTPAEIVQAIGIAARAQGISDVAKAAGLNRQNLYRALSGEGRPEFATIVSALRALGVKLTAESEAA